LAEHGIDENAEGEDGGIGLFQSNSNAAEILHHQLPASYSIVIYDQIMTKIVYEKYEASDDDIMSKFFDSLEEANDIVNAILDEVVECNMTPAEYKHAMTSVKECYLCGEAFDQPASRNRPKMAADPHSPTFNKKTDNDNEEEDDDDDDILAGRRRVLDHCHATGEFNTHIDLRTL
jgi:hypothetical protein